MPASEAQIAANRLNALRSSGPKTEAGKARSRGNALKHGLAGESSDLDPLVHPAGFEERRAKWAAERQPAGEAAAWALDKAVAASLRIDRCERAVEEVTEAARERARLAWDEDRSVEAATTFGRLARDPVLASRQLATTLAGVGLLIEAWLGLLAKLATGMDWSEAEASRALDLLGVASDLRSGRTVIDGPDGSDLVAFRRDLALDEVERLESLRDEALAPLDEMGRRRAIRGDIGLLTAPAKLLLRYERDAWRRYREAMAELMAPTPPPTPPAPVVAPAPAPPEVVEVKPGGLAEIERRIEALGGYQAVAAQARADREAATRSANRPATERTQSASPGSVGALPVGSTMTDGR